MKPLIFEPGVERECLLTNNALEIYYPFELYQKIVHLLVQK